MKSNIILRAFFGVVNAKLRKPCNSKNKIWLKFVDRENNDSYICFEISLSTVIFVFTVTIF
jgi:hypothetical protein